MKIKYYFSVLALLSVGYFFDVAIALDSPYESPPTFQADRVLKPKLVKGELFSVGPSVRNDGYLNHFALRSKFGTFDARGTLTLQKRIQELYALEVLEKEFPSSGVASKAVGESAVGIVTGPVRSVQKAYNHVSDKEKLKKTGKSIPGGVANLFGAAASAVSDGATFVYETGSSALRGDSEGTSAQFDKAGEVIVDAAEKYTGYDKAYRELSRALKIDPYTDNEVLRKELRRVALIQSGVKTGARFAPGLYGIPHVGTVNRYMDRAEEVAAYEDPKKVEALNAKIAEALGEADKNYSAAQKRFFANKYFTPLSRRIVLKNLERLKGVKDVGMFLDMAGRVRSREAAALYISAGESLADYHDKEGRLLSLVSQVVVPAGVTKNGDLIVPLPVDHLVWTKEVATVFKDFEKRVTNYPVRRSEIRIAGTASPRAIEELKRLGAEDVKQNSGYF